MPGIVLGLIVLSLLPLQWIRWMGTFGNLTTIFFTPGSAPVSAAIRFLMPARKNAGESDSERNYRELGEYWKTLALQHEREIDQLRRQIEELQRGLAASPDQPALRQLIAPVVGTSSDLSSGLLRVRADAKRGVTDGTVAVSGGLQIIGRVASVSGPTALILPITARSAGKVSARVMLDESTSSSLRCLLEPTGDGRLRGQVESPEGPDGFKPPAVGFTVRLDDPRWPRNAQMLIVGRVETVETDPSSPLRKVITVIPTLPVDRVSEVTLRIVGEEGGGSR